VVQETRSPAGSATITERVQFSKRLLEFRDPENPNRTIARFLEKPAVLERMKHMGQGIRLVSHKVRDAERGARECVSMFSIPQITDFRYVSPYVGKADYAKQPALVCRTWPYYRNTWDGKRAGRMAIGFYSASKGRGKVEYKPPSPADLRGCEIQFRPSKHYFDKHFTGKTLDFGRHGRRKASFAKDG
jgi:hypothetical protein